MSVTVKAEYASGCFCRRPELGRIETDYHPRFHFRRTVRRLAQRLGAENVRFGKGKVATAELPVACAHRERQAIRFDWNLSKE